MKKLFILLVLVVAVFAAKHFYFSNPPISYTCANEKTIKARFNDRGVKLWLSHDEALTLSKKSTDDESGVLFADEEKGIEFWVRDDSSFLNQGTTTLYEACRVIETVS